MRINKDIIVIVIFFIIVGTVITIAGLRFKQAIDSAYLEDAEQVEYQQIQERAKRDLDASTNQNKYVCGTTPNEKYDKAEIAARCVVEGRTKEQQVSYEQILKDNHLIATPKYLNQSRTGFSEGIYGENNFAEQYQVTGELDPDTIYQYQMDLYSTANRYYSDEEQELIEPSQTVFPDSEYATLLNPHASYKTLEQADLAKGYTSGLLAGSYPEDGTNQILISHYVAANLCGIKSIGCRAIDDLIGSEYQLPLTGYLADGTVSTVTATVQISGIYLGVENYNDIILAYDGLNPEDKNTSADLKSELLKPTPEVDSESSVEEEVSQTESELAEEARAKQEYEQNRAIVETMYEQQRNDFDQIISTNSNAISDGSHVDQSRAGLTDGIYSKTNVESQYQVQGTLEEDVIYRYYYELKGFNYEPYLSTEERSSIQEDSVDGHLLGDGEYATLLNPQAKYSTIHKAKLDTGYEHGLIAGEYPADGTNQIMTSYIVAANVCMQRASCDQIDDLLGQSFDLTLSGHRADGSESTITLTTELSGIYNGSTFFNDIILAYDGLNPSES